MNISLFLSVFILLIADETIAKSSGRGGGGGRGRSAARSSSKSFSRSRSSGGGKFHSGTSTYVHYDSSSFRSSVFGKSSNTYFNAAPTTGHTYIISNPSTPIVYDNHHYYWHGHYHTRPEKKTVCEYTISDEDGELMNVTFANGTSPKSLMFGCGGWEKCCGMSCCNAYGDWLALSIWFTILFIVIFYSWCRRN